MLSTRDSPPPMTLKERMKFFERAAETERTRSPVGIHRSISSTGASSAGSPSNTCSYYAAPRNKFPVPRALSSPGPVPRDMSSPVPRALSSPGKCTRVSLSRTISGESVVKEVVSPITLPTRGDVESSYHGNATRDINTCLFGEVRRESVELLEPSKTCYLATRMEPVENRVEEKGKGDVLPSDTRGGALPSDTLVKVSKEAVDRDSGVSCSSDDQDQLLSDTECYHDNTEFMSVDSGVYTQNLPGSKIQRVVIDPRTLSQSSESMSPTESLPTQSELSAINCNGHQSAESARANQNAESARANSKPALLRWSSLLEMDDEGGEEELELEEEEEEEEEEEDDATVDENIVSEEDVPTTQCDAPFHSPFEGTINLSMSAKESVTSEPPSHKGFLTIFQEESGLGAWNRRWCSVQDNKIYYWLYPEDEVNMNKEPHGEIDLRNCKTERVSVASRLDCARPNTFVLVILTAAKPGDRNSIITETNTKTTQTKYLLSADSREERKQWMEVLNKCLLTVISWNH